MDDFLLLVRDFSALGVKDVALSPNHERLDSRQLGWDSMLFTSNFFQSMILLNTSTIVWGGQLIHTRQEGAFLKSPILRRDSRQVISGFQ